MNRRLYSRENMFPIQIPSLHLTNAKRRNLAMNHTLMQLCVTFTVCFNDISGQNDNSHDPNYFHTLDYHSQSVKDQTISSSYRPRFCARSLLITYQLSQLMLKMMRTDDPLVLILNIFRLRSSLEVRKKM